jgi:acyl-CoA synthetase (AMP-forming)/AMP-acid ligase II
MKHPSFFLTRIAAALRAGGDRTAFRRDGVSTGYREAFAILCRLHAALAAEGVGPGEIVAIVGGNRPETVLAQLAVQARGAGVLLISASSSLPDRLAALATSAVTTLIVDPAHERAGTRELIDAVPSGRVLSLGPVPSWLPPRARDLLAGPAGTRFTFPASVRAVFPSGGTTGTPKLIAHSGIYDGMAHIFTPDPSGPGRILVVAPVTHMTGNAAVLGALLRGDTVVLHEGFEADAVLRDLTEERITALSLTPPRLAALLDRPGLAGTDLGHLRSLSLGASPLPPSRLEQALSVFGPIVGQGYGLTEAPMIASITAAETAGRLDSVGRIVPGMQARVVREDGSAAAAGEAGEVQVRGLAMMDGYHAQPALTRQAFDGDWLRTGDVGRFDAEGYLFLLDRLHDVIVTGDHGTKVYPAVVEHALATHPRVAEAAVIGVPGPAGEGELVHAVVVASGALDQAELRAHALAHFGQELFVPERVDFVERLPLTPVGKVDKRALRAPHWAGHARDIA